MRLFLEVPPGQEPVSLEEVKTYLRLSSAYEEEYLNTMISSSRLYVEGSTGRALLKQGWVWELTPPYPATSPLVQRNIGEVRLRIPIVPLLEIVSLKSRGKSVPYTLEETSLKLAATCWEQPLVLSFFAGYGETVDIIPQDLKLAVLMGTRLLYEGRNLNLPFLAPYRATRIL